MGWELRGYPLVEGSKKSLSKREASRQAPRTPEGPKPHAPVLCAPPEPCKGCGQRVVRERGLLPTPGVEGPGFVQRVSGEAQRGSNCFNCFTHSHEYFPPT